MTQIKLKKMPRLVRILALRKMTKEEKTELKRYGLELFINKMIAKPDNIFDRRSWEKMYKEL